MKQTAGYTDILLETLDQQGLKKKKKIVETTTTHGICFLI